jgi:hypothetical protein
MIDFRKFNEIMQYYEKYHKLQMVCQRYSHGNQQEKYNIAAEKRDNYKYNIYALAVFRAMSLLNPMMMDCKTNQQKHFNEIFGTDFEKLDNGTRGQLAGLMVGNYYQFQFLEQVTTVEGKILKTITMYDRKKTDGKSEIYEIQRLP